jgi:hypothetical protein
MPKRELNGGQVSSLGAHFDPVTSRPDLIELRRCGLKQSQLQLGIMAAKMQRVLDPFQLVQIAVAGWMNQPQQRTIDYFREKSFRATQQPGYDCGKRRSR